MSAAAFSASERPFETRGITLAMPPLPVPLPALVPLFVCLNQVSTVQDAVFSPAAVPISTYWLRPLKASDAFGAWCSGIERQMHLPPRSAHS